MKTKRFGASMLSIVSALTMAAALATPASATCLRNCGGSGGQNGSGSAWFNGGVLGENQTIAQGGLTATSSWLKKQEAGGAEVFQNTNGPDGASAWAKVGVMGGGSAMSLNGGWGASQSMTGVLGLVEGQVGAGTGN
jgi:hypothetical protein